MNRLLLFDAATLPGVMKVLDHLLSELRREQELPLYETSLEVPHMYDNNGREVLEKLSPKDQHFLDSLMNFLRSHTESSPEEFATALGQAIPMEELERRLWPGQTIDVVLNGLYEIRQAMNQPPTGTGTGTGTVPAKNIIFKLEVAEELSLHDDYHINGSRSGGVIWTVRSSQDLHCWNNLVAFLRQSGEVAGESAEEFSQALEQHLDKTELEQRLLPDHTLDMAMRDLQAVGKALMQAPEGEDRLTDSAVQDGLATLARHFRDIQEKSTNGIENLCSCRQCRNKDAALLESFLHQNF